VGEGTKRAESNRRKANILSRLRNRSKLACRSPIDHNGDSNSGFTRRENGCGGTARLDREQLLRALSRCRSIPANRWRSSKPVGLRIGPYSPALSQKWTLQKVANGGMGSLDQWRIINDNSGRCLDVIGASAADGTHVTQYQCLNSPPNNMNQVWNIIYLTPGWFLIKSVNSGKCLGVDNSYQGDTGASAAPPGNTYGINQWGCISVTSGPFQGPGNMHRTQVWNLPGFPNGTTGDCVLSQLVQRPALLGTDQANGMSSQMRRTVYSYAGCTPAQNGTFAAHNNIFIAQPGAHLGLGPGGNQGLIEVGLYRTRTGAGVQTDEVFSEIWILGNAVDFRPRAALCSGNPQNDRTEYFEVARRGTTTSWDVRTSCQAGVLETFTMASISVGLPSFEIELQQLRGSRAGAQSYALQSSVSYRRTSDGSWRTPGALTCWTSPGSAGLQGAYGSGTWQVVEGAQSCPG
jgi:Ricin-type beta-trefoil lectin domain-like